MANPPSQPRALTCPTCGAKLRWDRDAPVVECRYCHAHVVVETGRQTQDPAGVISAPGPGRGIWIAAAVVVGGAVIATIALGVRRTGSRSPRASSSAPVRRSTVAELLATPLASTPAQVATRHGLTSSATATSLAIPLAGGAFEEARLEWAEEPRDHVTAISLRPRPDADPTSAFVARARALVGRRLRPAATGGYQMSARGVGLAVSASQVWVSANLRDEPAWKPRLAAMWTVVRAAALGTDEQLDDHARRDLLNLAYPVSVVGEIDFDVDVDGAAREVRRVAPGSEHDGTDHSIGIEHPWIESASLSWENKAGGRWYSVVLYYPAELVFRDEHAEIAACLTPLLGAPRRLEQDHAAGTFSLQYRAIGGTPWVDLSTTTLQIYPHYTFGEPATAAGFRELIAAIAACPGRVEQ